MDDINEKQNPLTPSTRKKYQRHIKALTMSLEGCDETPRNKPQVNAELPQVKELI